nr:immunoglobulin light chain junction region [Macaca mulatta]MOX47816.1 immunoglobulin light chain junction region [Macaca mulatta]MOX47853.1 immunoglobulin light chain junction region [Macaca mulatta]MOX47857.1 immunoglobulin light chain junction region [Macaca mulatta]MOX47860.1 immunoglobulin light chain junction region [Macaca mulatta]
CQQHDNPPPTF